MPGSANGRVRTNALQAFVTTFGPFAFSKNEAAGTDDDILLVDPAALGAVAHGSLFSE